MPRLHSRSVIGILLNPFGGHARTMSLEKDELTVCARHKNDLSLDTLTSAPTVKRTLFGATLTITDESGCTYRLKGARHDTAKSFAQLSRPPGRTTRSGFCKPNGPPPCDTCDHHHGALADPVSCIPQPVRCPRRSKRPEYSTPVFSRNFRRKGSNRTSVRASQQSRPLSKTRRQYAKRPSRNLNMVNQMHD